MMNKNRSSPNQVFAVVLIAALFLVYMFAPPFLHVGSPGPAMAGFGTTRGFPSIVSKSITFTSGIKLNDDVLITFGTDSDANCEFDSDTNFICSGPSGATAQFGKGADSVTVGDGTSTFAPAITMSGTGVFTFVTSGGTDITFKVGANEMYKFLDGSANPGLVIDPTNKLIAGDITSGGDLTLSSTTHATKGKILFGTSAYDEVNNRLGIGTAAPDEELEVFGGSSTLRLRDSGATADATLAFMEFGGTDTGSWVRTGYVGDISSANTHIHLQAELGELHLGDSSGGSVVVLSGGSVGINAATPITTLTLGSGTFSIKELASADAPTAAHGQLWVKTATPNELWFTNDDGGDVQLGLPGGGALQTLTFGATWDGAGNFLQANGTTALLDGISSSETKQGAVAGTIQKMVFYHEGDLSSNNATIKIHANGTPVATKTASGAANVADVFNAIGVAVNDGDIIEVEFDAGSTNPGKSIVTIMIE